MDLWDTLFDAGESVASFIGDMFTSGDVTEGVQQGPIGAGIGGDADWLSDVLNAANPAQSAADAVTQSVGSDVFGTLTGTGGSNTQSQNQDTGFWNGLFNDAFGSLLDPKTLSGIGGAFLADAQFEDTLALNEAQLQNNLDLQELRNQGAIETAQIAADSRVAAAQAGAGAAVKSARIREEAKALSDRIRYAMTGKGLQAQGANNKSQSYQAAVNALMNTGR